MSESTSWKCRACGAARLQPTPNFASLQRVSSDCRPFRTGGELTCCGSCGLVQKPETPGWASECREIYSSYALYGQSSSGTEQKFFSPDGVGRPRSEYTLGVIAERLGLPATGSMLDVGSGTGAVLRAFHAVRPGWTMEAVEPNPRADSPLTSIAGVTKVHSTMLEHVPGRFDLITFFHVLEHVPELMPFLAQVRERLSPGGHVAIQVPNFARNPFDIVIADHCTHFVPETLSAALIASGLEVVRLDTEIIPKELTVVCRAMARPSAGFPAGAHGGAAALVQSSIQWLFAAQADAAAIAKAKGEVGIFGSSIAAAWLTAGLGDAVRFFVDEDTSRVGSTYLSRPIIAPASVPSGATVAVCAPGATASKIADRLSRPSVNYLAVQGTPSHV